MARYTQIIDPKKCVGCFACRVACQNLNELPPTNSFLRFEDKEEGKFPDVKYTIFPIQCQHCENAPCIDVCPTSAIYKTSEGLTQVDLNKCMGCRRCIAVCPYNARTYVAEEKRVKACSLCYQGITKGHQPACVSNCLTKARVFGDLDNPQGEFAKLLPKAKPLRADFGTKPRLLYILDK